jgi:uncharacterized membrane protein
MRRLGPNHRILDSIEARSLRSRNWLTRIADAMTAWCGTSQFLVINGLIFFVWITLNMPNPFGIVAFDPFPFGLLTMAVSLEAIFLSIFVLISQNRTSYTSTLRDEVNLQVNLIAEQEITKILKLVTVIGEKLEIKYSDREIKRMLKKVSGEYIEQQIQMQIEAANKNVLKDVRHNLPEWFKSKKLQKTLAS